MNTIGDICNVISMLGVVFLLWNTIRGRLLCATLDGEKLSVNTDEIREAFRRSALAEVSRINGGKRVSLDMKWRGNQLIITSETAE